MSKNLLAYALMGIGSGLTGNDYLGNYLKLSAQQEFNKWKKKIEEQKLGLSKEQIGIQKERVGLEKQKLSSQQKSADIKTEASLVGKGFVPDPNGDIMIGGKRYRYDPTIGQKSIQISGSLLKTLEPGPETRTMAVLQHLIPGTQGAEKQMRLWQQLKSGVLDRLLGGSTAPVVPTQNAPRQRVFSTQELFGR